MTISTCGSAGARSTPFWVKNGAGKSTLMSVLFGLYQPEAGVIKKNGLAVQIKNPNDATALGIGMVHQHFKLVDIFTVLDNIILGVDP